jgi:N-methylhydantoinase B
MAHGDTRIIPLELQEAIYPYRIEEFALREDSAGAGKFRGGLGFRKRYRILSPCSLWVNFDRIECPPWGVHGGKAALPGLVTILKRGANRPETLYKTEGYALEAGDQVIIETGGGGGYGPSAERSLAAIERDLARGYVSRGAALRDYGIAFTADGDIRRGGITP